MAVLEAVFSIKFFQAAKVGCGEYKPMSRWGQKEKSLDKRLVKEEKVAKYYFVFIDI